jgi:hypothetical protein
MFSICAAQVPVQVAPADGLLVVQEEIVFDEQPDLTA